jgi:secondary thiamine-phosphate synthase enzyme
LEVLTEHIKVSTQGNSEIVDITEKITGMLRQQKLKEGNVTIFVVGSTASVTTTEYEPGLKRDIPEMMERLAPSSSSYHHNNTWGDGNGHAHVRASFLGPSIVVPFSDGKMLLGTWQQIVLIDFDTRPRHRDIILQFIGK